MEIIDEEGSGSVGRSVSGRQSRLIFIYASRKDGHTTRANSPATTTLWPEQNVNGRRLHMFCPIGRRLPVGLWDRRDSRPRSLSSFSPGNAICEPPCSPSSSIRPFMALTIPLLMRTHKILLALCAYCIIHRTYNRHSKILLNEGLNGTVCRKDSLTRLMP